MRIGKMDVAYRAAVELQDVDPKDAQRIKRFLSRRVHLALADTEKFIEENYPGLLFAGATEEVQ